ncbi:hypothetical protein V2J09_010533, partial [Rumex salicifolius]
YGINLISLSGIHFTPPTVSTSPLVHSIEIHRSSFTEGSRSPVHRLLRRASSSVHCRLRQPSSPDNHPVRRCSSAVRRPSSQDLRVVRHSSVVIKGWDEGIFGGEGFPPMLPAYTKDSAATWLWNERRRMQRR